MPISADASFALLLVALGYAALCAVSPFGNCRKCRGFGVEIRTDRKGRPRPGRTCPRCHGDRKRIRLGRHLFNLVSRAHHDGTR
ncbi:hypothetical protein [Streptomyces sp. JJ38]|uniref:hypothetical protein n=1 Tax=Streptomyces sp. JJ38 TaxID=2738128 RepID=UPI001C588B6F|nr:hypothetical protein [Streptomyces sp. JJ38]MBW1597922.1 hypothetical protein [Streptomyces sp. JJ38]